MIPLTSIILDKVSKEKNLIKLLIAEKEPIIINFENENENINKICSIILYNNLKFQYNRFNSFSPIRKNIKSFWFVNVKI
jgi:hypothetical protein